MDQIKWMSLLLILAAVVMIYIAFLSYQKRHLPVARTLILIMIGASFYAVGYAFELLSSNLQEVKLALQIEYIGIPFISTLWFYQVIQFTGTVSRYRRRLALVLFFIPTAIFFLHLTNDWHHLIYESYSLNKDALIPLYTTVKGVGYQVHVLYNYFVLLCGYILLLPKYWNSSRIVRRQIIVLAMAAAAPMLCNMFFWFGIVVDLTPFGFVASGMLYVWGILKFHLLRFTPIAMTQLFDTIRDGVVLLDDEDRIVGYNRAAELVLPELHTKKQYPAYVGDLLSHVPELVEFIRSADAWDERVPFHRHKPEGDRFYLCSVTYIYDSDVAIGKMILFYDITQLKANEAQLRENARQLSELNAFKDKLFTIVAHDIRDPIAILVNLTELLGEELAATEDQHAEVFLELQRQVQGTFQLVENLLDWYRSQNGKVMFHPLDWNLQQVVYQTLSIAGSKAGLKLIRLTERIDDRITVSADKEMLDFILRNLIANAIKYTHIGGWVEVVATLEGDQVTVCIRDNGEGIDELTAELLRQEEPIFKAPANGEEAGNTRFGVVLAREFVHMHGGSLWFNSVSGEGSTFCFTLPGSMSEGRSGVTDDPREERRRESNRGGR
ncbi:histidine kinase/DNA gyrase B/HSP90-like ATPase [Paenibacillus cellulosilyticus]|uniref:histidine kinase n=1 Tax=Paenibacillus cellulosilyticus TaxID=375489 RepID=A0A2V2YU02_9BACL|nr:histidine kinase N-terminal 7TM domain-containing protein [Paenibacillus cellulosilyticus]PWW02924.1 histidine kinase/DNA gyrase B/HSP90-like ATPase [Paenibacillus cellulosilyticus]QKS45832.1 hypothetical protein HUB94_16330 [Paenibacillus cellulosilyticus]